MFQTTTESIDDDALEPLHECNSAAANPQKAHLLFSGASQWLAVGKWTRHLVHKRLVFFEQPLPVLSRHLHALRHTFLISRNGFRKRVRRRALRRPRRPK